MNSSDALEVFREEMNDEATPYLWSDGLVFRYLDQAQKNFCRWTEGIEDSTTTAITQATVTAGVDWVELDKRVEEAAVYVCRQLERMYPAGGPERRQCTRDAIDDAQPQVLVARVNG